ncbi:hypothetical protein EMIHUDRAFT_210007 [Emiliania huxleyi CCMP1516]|uniref:Uncharacterized protein n=2 Tax=Emiliania huxleyi TaxID=2903 RepID=A0A0D3J1H1_EMIH1|nr:hypothetical protein EMIHUDRAFT_210007 [Emiliania huxleyi CCMP1516]EOD17356.1 hypothetical protein EMIHUDRAFT_210007 [Emiliania huxleyi CCMP1516]|eukprot:XP_005769785.1 hypothetical protein EMIHUDRAFT_210007 [Emiliania huxleyi CCMP1516]
MQARAALQYKGLQGSHLNLSQTSAKRQRTEGPTSESCFFGLGTSAKDRLRYATVYLVRNALAGIERATCSTERLAVRTPSCGSRRERFAARRVGEHVSSDVSLKTAVRQEELDGEREPSEVLTEVSEERVYRFDGSTVLIIKTDVTYIVTHQTTHILPPAGSQNALDESHKKPSAQEAARRTGVLA